MKAFLPSSLLGAVLLCVLASSPMPVSAQNAVPVAKAPVETPLNCRCVVTVDPQYRAVEQAEQSPKGGFTGPNMLEGIIVRLDQEWLVLRDGSFENWIPAGKVLSIRVSR